MPVIADGPEAAASLAANDAVRLFVERATEVAPHFALTSATGPVIVEICRRLDGIPLALELAAARIKALSPGELLARLDQPLALLTGGPRDAPARQQTLRATLRWSYDLLTPTEQRLFRQLSVFAGGWTLEAAEAVVALGDDNTRDDGEQSLLDGLSSLVDKSLVQRIDPPGQAARYGMLEPIRQFAGDDLARHDAELAGVRRRHARYVQSVVVDLLDRINGPDTIVWFERIETEHDNLRAALRWAREVGEIETGLRLVGELGIFWGMRGYVTEGWDQIERFLSAPGAARRTAGRADALWAASWVRFFQGKGGAMLPLADEACSICEELGDRCRLAKALLTRGEGHHQQGIHDRAREDWERALALFRECGDAVMAARVLVRLGAVAFEAGDLDQAIAILQEALALARAREQKIVIALALGTFGAIAERMGEDDRAAAYYRERLLLYSELGMPRVIAVTLEQFAHLAHRQRQLERAACLFGAAATLHERSGSVSDRIAIDAEIDAVRAALPDPVFQAAWARGRAMSIQQSIDLALEPFSGRDSGMVVSPGKLSPREADVLRLIAAGRSNREIAAELFISVRTVERHIENLYRKLDVHNRADAVAIGRQQIG
jgi:predicted ATPase/DNA-binding CsgD family transcriptional regulator